MLLHTSPLLSDKASLTGDFIRAEAATTLPGLFAERLRRSPHAIAYQYFDTAMDRWQSLTWEDMDRRIRLWQGGLKRLNLRAGDRIGIMIPNGPDWVALDLAAQGLDLVVVPLFHNDRPENAAWCLEDCSARFLLVEKAAQWFAMKQRHPLPQIRQCVCLDNACHQARSHRTGRPDQILTGLRDWLPLRALSPLVSGRRDPDALATLCYTSGTTGHPKGVMLTHRNILWNADAGLRTTPITANDRFLSFLPLSHMLERTVGYTLPMMAGASVAFARSVADLAEDLQTIRPTVLISVPRVFERFLEKVRSKLQARETSPLKRRLFELAVDVGWARFESRQDRAPWDLSFLLWPLLDRLVVRKLRARLGGRIRVAVCGGAPLGRKVSRTFIGLGLPLIQGYGLTEASPIISVNRLSDNEPESVGYPLPEVEIRRTDNQELLIRSPGVMAGYWKRPHATEEVIDSEGWLHTGDLASLRGGHIHITGRSKDIIVLSNGENVCPADLEQALLQHEEIDQALVFGEGQARLSAVIVPSTGSRAFQEPRSALSQLPVLLADFPGYIHIDRVFLQHEPWTVENGMLTPTLKVRRKAVLARMR